MSGILPLLFQVFKHQPRFGGLCVDVKGVLLEVRPLNAPADWQPRHRFNLVGDRSIPFATYARCVVDTAVALGSRREQSFFRNYLAQPPEQLAGITGTVANYLH